MSTEASPGPSPTGDVGASTSKSFVFTDIEGSTTLWAEHPDQMSQALARHDDLVDEVVGGHGGTVVKSKGEGDSTLSVFPTPRAAVWAAAELQRRLFEEAWPEPVEIRVRVGIHTGPAEFRGGDYYGSTLNQAARVRSLAAGRQVFLSAETAAGQRGDLPRGVSLVDLGPHRLRGIPGTHPVYALAGPGLITPRADCPYLGLLAFDVVDRDLFFGREAVVAALSDRVRRGGLVALVGSSGSGKSSVLRAGLLGALGGRLITPGASPPEVPASDDLLIVDQFEELFTLVADEAARTRFLDALLARRGPVVIGIRADFYGHCATYPAFAEVIARNHVLLGPMTADELRAAITGPAEAAQLKLEPGLVELLVAAVHGEPGALPLLSHALLATWENREGRTLTIDAYQATGGVQRAIAATADRVLNEMSRPDLLRRIVLRLIEPREDGEDTRRVARREELGTADERERVDRILDELAAARLITTDADSVQLSHEALIREWPTLREWIGADRAGLLLHQHLREAAAAWAERGRWNEELYRGARLAAAREWAAAQPEALSPVERDFLAISQVHQDRTLHEQAKTNRRLRVLLSGTVILLVLAMVALVVAVSSRSKAVDAETTARAKGLAAVSQVQQSVDPERAILLAAEAVRMKATPETMFALRAAVDASPIRYRLPQAPAQDCGGTGVSYNPDPHRASLVEVLCDGTVRFANADTGEVVRTAAHDGVRPAFLRHTADGSAVIVPTADRVLALDPQTGEVLRRSPVIPGIVDLAVHPRRPEVAILTAHQLSFWDAASGKFTTTRPKPLLAVRKGEEDTGFVSAIGAERFAYTPDGRRLGVVMYGNAHTAGVALYDIARARIVRSVTLPNVEIQAFAFSPDGRHVALGEGTGEVGEIALRDADSLKPVRGFTPVSFVGDVASRVAFSPDGNRIVYSFNTGSAGVVSARTGRPIERFPGSTAIIHSISFRPDGAVVATGSQDGTARAWRATDASLRSVRADLSFPAEVIGTSDGFVTARWYDHPAFLVRRWTADGRPAAPELSLGKTGKVVYSDYAASPDGRYFGFVRQRKQNRPGTLDVWDVVNRRQVRTATIKQPFGAFAIPALSADGRYAVRDGIPTLDARKHQLQLIDLASHTTQVLADTDCAGWAAYEFSRSGRYLAAGTFCGEIGVWEVATGREVGPRLQLGGELARLAFSPDERSVVGSWWDTRITVSPVPPNGSVATLTENTQGVREATYSPDGRLLASAGLDGTLRIYDVATLSELRVIRQGSPPDNLAFTPDSRTVVTVGRDYGVTMWDACTACGDAKALLELAAAAVTRELTDDERRQFGATG